MIFRKIAPSVLGLAAIGAVVWAAVRLSDPERVLFLLRDAPPWTFIAMAALKALQDLVRALRFSVALPSTPRIGLLQYWKVVSIHQFLNLVMPARTGEISLVYLAVNHLGQNVGAASGALAFVRLLDVLCLTIFFTVALTVFAAGAPHSVGFAWIGTALAAAVLSLMFCLPYGLRVARSKLDGTSRWPRLEGVLADCHQYFLARLSRIWLLRLILFSALQYLALFELAWVSVRAVGFDPSPAAVVIGASGAIVTNLLPINPVGSLGTLEGGWVLGFVLAGVDVGVAIASGVYFHAAILIYAGCAAGISYLDIRRCAGRRE